MYLNNLMDKHCMSRADLVRVSGVPDSTLRDILKGTAQIDHCEVGTLYEIALALDTTVEEIVEHYWQELIEQRARTVAMEDMKIVHDDDSLVYFYITVSATMDGIRNRGEKEFIRGIRDAKWVEQFYSQKSYRTVLFLVGLMDYLNRKHNISPDPRYDNYRKLRLDKPVYSLDTLEQNDDGDAFEEARKYAENNAIRELARFNIFMTEDDIRLRA